MDVGGGDLQPHHQQIQEHQNLPATAALGKVVPRRRSAEVMLQQPHPSRKQPHRASMTSAVLQHSSVGPGSFATTDLFAALDPFGSSCDNHRRQHEQGGGGCLRFPEIKWTTLQSHPESIEVSKDISQRLSPQRLSPKLERARPPQIELSKHSCSREVGMDNC